MKTKKVNGKWALSRVVALLADAMEENPDNYNDDDYAALDVSGQVVFRIEDDEEYNCTNPWAFRDEDTLEN